MLLEMRKVTRGVFATVILGAIAVAMVLFLIPRIGGSSFTASVAQVGNTAIGPAELSRNLDAAIEQANANGQHVTRDEAIAQNAHRQVLEGLIRRTALYEYARRQGVDVSDAQLASMVRQMQGLQNPVTGRFDEAMLDQALSRRRLTRADFLNDLRVEATDGMVMESLVAGVRPPPSYGALLVAYRNESRIVSVAEAPVSVVGAPPAPTEAQLQAFYQTTREAWRVPEYRAVTLVYARDADFAARANVTDAQIDALYEQRRASLTQPEKRSSIRIAAQNEQQANAIAQRLAHGENADAVARSLGLQAIHGSDEPRTGVSDANVAAAVFSMTPSSPPRVVRGALAPFVVVQVTSVTAATNPDAAAISNLRTQIRQQLALEQATDLKAAASNAFDEARGGGVSTAEAARRAGLQVVTIPATDAQGNDAAGAPIAAFAGDNNELLRTTFHTAEGEASDFIPVSDGVDVVVSVDHITPAAIRPFAEVRTQIAQRWTAQELSRRAQEFANTVVREIQGGQSLTAVAAAHHMRIAARSQAINREQASHLPSRRLGAQIFAAPQGGAVSDVLVDPTGGGGILVAVVEQIHRIDPRQVTPEMQQTRQAAARGIAQDLSEAIQAQVVADTHVQRHDDVIRSNFRST
ncbi:MAG: SurA N-terminal domain-containing protein, partial [Proteobacteria bacterium]|nr:SurA N-terminal domain-containing protein [Pseudomonadota bacterium]